MAICWADKGAFVGGMIILVYLFLAAFGPYVAHIPYGVGNPADAYLAPSWHHLLGTDNLGHDVLAEIVIGCRPVIEVGIAAAVMITFVGVVAGLVSGFFGGLFDSVLMRVVDVFLTIPSLPLVIVIAGVVQATNPLILAAILWFQGEPPRPGHPLADLQAALATTSSTARVQGLSLRNIVGKRLLQHSSSTWL